MLLGTSVAEVAPTPLSNNAVDTEVVEDRRGLGGDECGCDKIEAEADDEKVLVVVVDFVDDPGKGKT